MPRRKKPPGKARPTSPRADSEFPEKRNPPANEPKPRRQWKEPFLLSFAASGNVLQSCLVAGVDRTTAYKAYHGDEAFKKAWQSAEEDAADLLEAEATRRAVEGVDKPVFYMGEEVATVKEYSDQLLIVLLKARRPGRFRENVKVQHTGPADGPIKVETKKTESVDYDQLAQALEKHAAGAAAGRVRPDSNS